MKYPNVFNNSVDTLFNNCEVNRKPPSFDINTVSLDYFPLPENIKCFFEAFIFLIDDNNEYYFYGSHSSCSKFIVKFIGNEMIIVTLKNFKNVKILSSIIGTYVLKYNRRVKVNYNSDENG